MSAELERELALKEAHRIKMADQYFANRPHIAVTPSNILLFEAGFDRGYEIALLLHLRKETEA